MSRSAARLAISVTSAALVLPWSVAGCDASGSHVRSSRAVTALCLAGSLRIRGGRQGEEQGAHGDVELINTGDTACTLAGLPTISLLRSDGAALPVQAAAATKPVTHSVTLIRHGGSAWLTLFWSNWCGTRPGPLDIALRLSAGGGTVQGPFNGPPDYDFVPVCVSPGQPSTLQILDAYDRQA